jgi:hypothetical protein
VERWPRNRSTDHTDSYVYRPQVVRSFAVCAAQDDKYVALECGEPDRCLRTLQNMSSRGVGIATGWSVDPAIEALITQIHMCNRPQVVRSFAVGAAQDDNLSVATALRAVQTRPQADC